MNTIAKTAEEWGREILDAAFAPHTRLQSILPLIFQIRAEGERAGLKTALKIVADAQSNSMDMNEVYDQIMKKLGSQL